MSDKPVIHLVLRPGQQQRNLKQGILELDQICFPDDFRPAIHGTWWWVAYVDGKPAGYAGMKYLESDRFGYFTRAGVLPRYRNKGIHKKLIAARTSYARRRGWRGVLTYTMADNYKSINALVAKGFRIYSPEYAWVGRKGITYLTLQFPEA